MGQLVCHAQGQTTNGLCLWYLEGKDWHAKLPAKLHMHTLALTDPYSHTRMHAHETWIILSWQKWWMVCYSHHLVVYERKNEQQVLIQLGRTPSDLSGISLWLWRIDFLFVSNINDEEGMWAFLIQEHLSVMNKKEDRSFLLQGSNFYQQADRSRIDP